LGEGVRERARKTSVPFDKNVITIGEKGTDVFGKS
jgi:hypothetical protein